MNFDYLDRKMSIGNKKELRDRLLLRSAQLDFSRLAKDLEPFVYAKKEVDRVLILPFSVLIIDNKTIISLYSIIMNIIYHEQLIEIICRIAETFGLD